MKMMNRAGRNRQRGMTLLEAIISVLVLSIGVVAIFGMITRVSSANRSTAFQSDALDSFSTVAAQIRDAQCDFPGDIPGMIDAMTTDPGLAMHVDTNMWVNAATPNSIIAHVGDIPESVPPLRVSYRVRSEMANPNPTIPALEIDVRVREITNDAARDLDTLEDGYWIHVFPVKKVCNPRYDSTSRGEY